MPSQPGSDRRSFLRSAAGSGLLAAGGLLASTQTAEARPIRPPLTLGGGTVKPPAKPKPKPKPKPTPPRPLSAAEARREAAYRKRIEAADDQRAIAMPAHAVNSDESLHANSIGSFTKAMPHNAIGEVLPSAYQAYLKALVSGKAADFAAIPLGGSVRLANPQAAYAFSLEGADSHHLGLPAAPALASAWAAGEMVEIYWRAWTRDVPFLEYASSPQIAAAAVDLSALPDFRGPKAAGQVTAATVFRGPWSGDEAGPLVSQFLWKDVPSGAATIQQRYRTSAENDNHLTSQGNWLHVQNGGSPLTSATPDGPYYIASGRDLAEYVHYDFSYQAFLNAALILLSFGGGAVDDRNPYKAVANQGGFVTFGAAHILDLVARVAIEALKAAWYQKWLLHRRLRPEAYGGLVHHHVEGDAVYPIHPSVLNSAVLPLIQGVYSTSLLPVAYPEGCPTHPAYPAGHATIAGACVTVLKAFFKESFEIPAPVQANSVGDALLPYAGALTVGGELNKLASNIALGRDTAGVHWRTDGEAGMRLGEEVALRLLRDHRRLHHEPFTGFSLTKFDGSSITV
jgi:hypothetical protein